MSSTVHAKGKRKRAVARATLEQGTGNVVVNGESLVHFGNNLLQMRVNEPLILAGDAAKAIDAYVTVQGGGVNGQADAARLAIARALVRQDGKLKKVFESYDRLLLVADIRRKETRKPNDSKARAKRQKSYR